MLSLRRPTLETIREFLEAQGKLPLTYPAVGATAGAIPLSENGTNPRRTSPKVFDPRAETSKISPDVFLYQAISFLVMIRSVGLTTE